MKILYLYPQLMNLYGEYGNIKVLEKHIKDQGYKVTIEKTDTSIGVDFEKYDFVYCGSGLESNQKVALLDLIKNSESFKNAVNKGVHMLFTGNAMELLGKYLDEEEALGIVDMSASFTKKRFSGDVILKNDEFGEVVGFINKCTLITNTGSNLFSYVFKDRGLNEISSKEGYRVNNVFGTHAIGPVLVKNPLMLKYFVSELCKKENKKFIYKEIDYPYEKESYNITLNALKERI